MTLHRDGMPVVLPASRKVRALLAYLALATRAVARNELCDLLWEVPNDPRGELRWCLSKIRNIVDEPGCRRVHTAEGTVWLDLAGCTVDAIELAVAAESGFTKVAVPKLRALSALFTGEFLEGLEIERSPVFNGWLSAQRRRFSGWRVELLALLARTAGDEDIFVYLEKWLQLAPFDRQAHATLLLALAGQGRIREGEEHLAAAARQFQAEGLDPSPIRDAWRAARLQGGTGTATATGTAETAGPAAVLATHDADAPPVPAAARRASIAIMPFTDASPTAGARGGAADALAHDVITRLAKLRSMFVIAQGTVFALHERQVGAEEAGRLLNVDYVVSGSVRRHGRRLTVTVELADARSARIVWTENFNREPDKTLLVLDEIGNRIVASIASEVETAERNRAVLLPPNSLDAWEAHHRGLWHMYRFSKIENEQARHFFETAVRLDPTFARAFAGLSFTHWQNAFQGWAEREVETERAFESAGQSLMVDDRDPAAHWAMGRALWLRGRHDQSVVELERSIDLSPNFALGHYTLAFVQSQAGDPRSAIASSDHSRELSPFDPLLFGMLGSRAMALVRLGEFEEGAYWAVKAAARPNAHPHILAIAAYSLSLVGSLEEARAYAATIRRVLPAYGIADFLGAFRFDEDGEALFRRGAARLGMS